VIAGNRVLLDACTLENFAVVKRLDLLQELFQMRAAWTAWVEREVIYSAAQRPHLEPLMGAPWLGEPIEFDDPLAIQGVDRIRRALGGSVASPRQHLGEAQGIYYLATSGQSVTMATDDRAAYAMAERRGLRVVGTPEILRACYERALIACPTAYELLVEMADAGRGVQLPPSHWHICPS
jgi:predicted nucleic acid-binding protein